MSITCIEKHVHTIAVMATGAIQLILPLATTDQLDSASHKIPYSM